MKTKLFKSQAEIDRVVGYVPPGRGSEVGMTEEQRQAHNDEYYRKEVKPRLDANAATNAERIRERLEKGERRSGTSFGDVIFGPAGPVKKMAPPADKVREYDVKDLTPERGPKKVDTSAMDAADARMGDFLESMNGRTTSESPDPEWPADTFLSPSGKHGQRPMSGYEMVMVDPWLGRPRETNFRPRTLGGNVLARPENFSAPQPGDKKAGDGHVVKGNLWRGTAAYREPTPEELANAAEDHAQTYGDDEPRRALETKLRAEVEPVDDEPERQPAEKRRVQKGHDGGWQSLHGPRRWHR
jgi:hypothetical protein